MATPNAPAIPHGSGRVRTGIRGLDEVLGGGLSPQRMYLLEGRAGSGKTTLALHFLLEGARRGERALFVTLSETPDELAAIAASHGWSLDGVSVLEMSSRMAEESDNTLYQPAEVELGERMQSLLAEIDRLGPTRVVLDSCSELRLLAQSALRFRREILALKDRVCAAGATVLLLDVPGRSGEEMPLETLVHGVVQLEQLAPAYGAERRRLRVVKLRGVRYRGGYHDFVIRTGGLHVYPRLVAAEHHAEFEQAPVGSGVAELDALLGGGPTRGTSLLLMGPAGCGKSSVAAQYALAAAERGERAAVFVFDESAAAFRARAASLGMDLARHLAEGRLLLQQVDPAELSPGEFVHAVQHAVEADEARVVVVDSLTGFLNAMPEERFLALQLHETLSYLSQLGVLTIVTVAQHGLVGAEAQAPVDVSYLADAVLLFRYFEADGRVRKALSVVKKRTGAHESTIRELVLGPRGVRVGPVLADLAGVLSGHPYRVEEAGGAGKAPGRPR